MKTKNTKIQSVCFFPTNHKQMSEEERLKKMRDFLPIFNDFVFPYTFDEKNLNYWEWHCGCQGKITEVFARAVGLMEFVNDNEEFGITGQRYFLEKQAVE